MPKYGRIFTSIWEDVDFLALNAGPQRAYMLLVTQKDISACGVLPLTERRWARLAPDTDADSVHADLAALEATNFVVVDDDTEELAVRSYVKHDGQWKSPNGRKAIDRAAGQVSSTPLRNLVVNALSELLQMQSDTRSTGAAVPPVEGAALSPLPGDASPQQPAASSLHPSTSSQQPGPLRQPTTNGLHPEPALAAAAFEILATHKLANTNDIHSPGGYRRKLLEVDLPAEFGARIADFLHTHPVTTPAEICSSVLGMDPHSIRQAVRRIGQNS